MPRRKASEWLLSVLLWVWVGTFYFFIEVAWKTAHGRPEAISWTMLALAILLNIWLGLGIWDYSAMPWNLLGQICPQFFLVWIALSMFGIVMLDWMRYTIEGGERPHYKLV